MILVVLALAGASSSAREKLDRIGPGDTANPPNILLIITDDQRADTLGATPQARKTLGRAGTTYKQAYTAATACCVSRASIYTGRYPHNHGVYKNGAAEYLDQSTTVQAYLDEAGYNTAIAGKYFQDWRDHPPHFDRFATLYGGPRVYYYGGRWDVDGEIRIIDKYSTRFITRATVEHLRDFEGTDSTPWFMVVTPMAPHKPFTPEEKYKEARVPRLEPNPATLEEDISDKPAYVAESQLPLSTIRAYRRDQLRTLMSVDDLLGRIDTELADLQERRRTVAFFMSDSGYSWGEHGIPAKSNPYTPATHIPLIVKGKNFVDDGGKNTDLVTNIDIAPTIMDLVGLQPDEDVPMDGKSLLDGQPHERVLLRSPHVDTYSLRTPEYQYIQTGSGEDLFEEYYDLVADPYMLENTLADDDPSNDPPDLAELRLQLEVDKSCSGEMCP